MKQSEETFKMKNDDDPKTRVFISLKFRVKSTLVFQVLRNQRLELEFFCLLDMVWLKWTFNVKNDDDPEPRVLLILKFRVEFTLAFQAIRNQRLE